MNGFGRQLFIIVPADEVRRGHRNGKRPSVRPSEVSDHYLEKWSLDLFQIWCMHLLGQCSELINFWVTLAQFWPSSGQKWLRIGQNVGFRPLSQKVFTQSSSELICFWAMLDQFWPSSGQKIMTENGSKLLVSNHYQKTYSHNPIQTCDVHLLGEFSEFIHFWATLAKFWPSNGHRMTENGGFWPLSEKVLTQFNSNLVCTLIEWVFRTDSLLGHVGPILAL